MKKIICLIICSLFFLSGELSADTANEKFGFALSGSFTKLTKSSDKSIDIVFPIAKDEYFVTYARPGIIRYGEDKKGSYFAVGLGSRAFGLFSAEFDILLVDRNKQITGIFVDYGIGCLPIIAKIHIRHDWTIGNPDIGLGISLLWIFK